MKSPQSSKVVTSLFVFALIVIGALVILPISDRTNAQQRMPGSAKTDASTVLIDL